MDPEHRTAVAALEAARRMFVENVRGVTIEEALGAAGGFRSVLGLAKHTAAWAAVYHSFAFDERPRSWNETDWPRGLRERIEPTAGYLAEVLGWFERSAQSWIDTVGGDVDLDRPTALHWGETWPLRDVVAYVAAHWAYHAGEVNMILAIRRGEAWEYGEHVEENHISTIGHAVRRPWLTDEDVERAEREMRAASDPSESPDG